MKTAALDGDRFNKGIMGKGKSNTSPRASKARARGTKRQQKSHRVRRALLHCWRSSSDREIAVAVGTSNRTVSLHRKRLEAEGLILPRAKSTQVNGACLHEVCTSAVAPARLNEQLYDPVDESEPSFLALVESIREHGILESLVVSDDGYILSGHRRHAAAKYLELQRIPVRIRHDVSHARDQDKFLRLLASYNRQRVKTTSEQLHEEVALMGGASCSRVRRHRRDMAAVDDGAAMELRGRRRRSTIRDKLQFREAILRVVDEEKDNWPLSDRTVFYRLLNIKGLVRNDRTGLPYENTASCYDDVTNMLTRLRLDGSVAFEAITDETRPVVVWDTHRCVGNFVRRECDQFLTAYWRDLLQSQPNWIELLVEKNTVASQLRRVAGEYTLPMTSGRGYSSLPPRKDMVDRFDASGRENLIVIVVSDFDSEGEDIPSSFGISLRDDFGVSAENLQVVKAALTAEQVQTLDLHEGQLSKDSSSRYKRFVEEHGDRAWELESLTTDHLREIVEAAIRSVLDTEAFDAEVKREQQEQRELKAKRCQLRELLIDDVDPAA